MLPDGVSLKELGHEIDDLIEVNASLRQAVEELTRRAEENKAAAEKLADIREQLELMNFRRIAFDLIDGAHLPSVQREAVKMMRKLREVLK